MGVRRGQGGWDIGGDIAWQGPKTPIHLGLLAIVLDSTSLRRLSTYLFLANSWTSVLLYHRLHCC